MSYVFIHFGDGGDHHFITIIIIITNIIAVVVLHFKFYGRLIDVVGRAALAHERFRDKYRVVNDCVSETNLPVLPTCHIELSANLSGAPLH